MAADVSQPDVRVEPDLEPSLASEPGEREVLAPPPRLVADQLRHVVPEKSASNGRDAEQIAHVRACGGQAIQRVLTGIKQGLDHGVDVAEKIALEVEADVILLEDQIVRVLGKLDRVDDGPLAFGAGLA